MIVCVIVARVWITIAGVVVIGGRDAFEGTIADLRAEIFDLGFTKDTTSLLAVVLVWVSYPVDTYIHVLLVGDL